MAPQVEVRLEANAIHAEVEAVSAIFADFGFDADVGVDPDRRGAGGEYPWVVVISLSLSGFLGALGADAYRSMKKFVAKLYRARRGRQPGSVVLLDPDTGVETTLPPELRPPYDEYQFIEEAPPDPDGSVGPPDAT